MYSDFINSDDFIRKIPSKSIRLYPVFIKKRFSEKMRNSGNYNYNYAHSFFVKDF